MFDNSTDTKPNVKSPNILNHSSELIKTLTIDFSVYSIYCDIQNVFYLNGAKKPPRNSSISIANLSLGETTHEMSKKPGLVKQEKSFRTEKKSGHGRHGGGSVSRSGVSSLPGTTITTRRRTAQATGTAGNIGNNNNNNSGSNSAYLFSNIDDLYEA